LMTMPNDVVAGAVATITWTDQNPDQSNHSITTPILTAPYSFYWSCGIPG
jgi:hypothetical protein